MLIIEIGKRHQQMQLYLVHTPEPSYPSVGGLEDEDSVIIRSLMDVVSKHMLTDITVCHKCSSI